jgi:hypothetical protein
MAELNKQSRGFGSKRVFRYINENPHMAVSIGLFLGGVGALTLNITPLAGSLFGAGGALLGAWITELNKRRTDAEEKAKRQAEAVDALAPELQRTIERVQYILDRAAANFICEAAVNGIETKDQQADFRPYRPTLYPSAPQVRDLPGEKAIALIRFYDSLNDIEKLADDWWEREGQLAVNIFNVILHAAEKSLRVGLVCIREFDLEERFPPPYESWGTLTSRIERSLDNANTARQYHVDRSEARRLDPVKAKEPAPFRKY